jgi:Fe-S-cluster containining protein
MGFEEMRSIAEHLGLALAAFKRRFGVTWDDDTKKWMIDANPDGCPLLTPDKACSVHPVKPMQCQTFPFWPELVEDEAGWEDAKTYCPGMDAANGRLYSAEEIRAIAGERRGT